MRRILFLIIPSLILLSNCGRKKEICIGLVGPMTGKGKGYGKSMRQAMSMLVDEVNKKGGIRGRKVKLIIKDDKNNKELARKRAIEFAKENKVLIVIGHYYSSCCLSAQDVYKKAHIPTITPSATNVDVARKSEWMFRATFDDEFQGKFLANYAKKILKTENVIIIHDEDAYGSGLRDYFLEAAHNIGLKIKKIFSYNNKNPDYSFISEIKKIKTDLIFLACHAPEAAEIVKLIRKKGIKTLLLGPDALGSRAFIEKVGEYGEGIYATSPLLFDIAGEEAQVFFYKYKERYNEEPDWQAAFTYDAGIVALEAIKHAGLKREEIRKYLLSIDTPEEGIKGVTGNNYFDRHGSMVKLPMISRLTQGEFISTLMQLEVPSVFLKPEEIKKYEKEGRLFIIEGIPMFKTHVVYTGIDIIDIIDFNEKAQTVTLDFYLWFRWKGDIDPTDFEFLNGEVEDMRVIRKREEGNFHYICYRIKGIFKGSFDFKTYPFDTQILRVNLRHKKLSRIFLVYVVDVMGISETHPKVSISNWKIKKIWQYSGEQRSETSLGDPEMLTKKLTIASSTYNLAIMIKRITLPYLIKFLVPLLIVIIVCFIQFFIYPDELEVRAGIGITALLTAIAFHMSQSENLPQVGYIITSDKFFFVAYVIIFLSMVETAIVSYFFKKENIKVSFKIDRVSKILFPILYILSLIGIILWK